MKIIAFSVRNYKSFADSGRIMLSEHFNLITGKNNSGKSSLIEPLATQGWSDKPHRSVKHAPGMEPPKSELSVEIRVTGEEIKKAYVAGGANFSIPLLTRVSYGSPQSEETVRCIDRFFAARIIDIRATRFAPDVWQIDSCEVDGQRCVNMSSMLNLSSYKQKILPAGLQDGFGSFDMAVSILVKKSWYSFKAERLTLNSCKVEGADVLLPDAQNLADVLMNFHNKLRARFTLFLQKLQQIIPNINDVKFRTEQRNTLMPQFGREAAYPHVRVAVSLVGSEEDREDLAFDLNDCGTGIGQVFVHSLCHHELRAI